MNKICRLDIDVDKKCFELLRQKVHATFRAKWTVRKMALRDFNTLKWNIGDMNEFSD